MFSEPRIHRHDAGPAGPKDRCQRERPTEWSRPSMTTESKRDAATRDLEDRTLASLPGDLAKLVIWPQREITIRASIGITGSR